jgi:putative transposase
MIASFANAMMSAQADQVCGAGWGERSDQRVNRRNGYRAREWDTRAGTIELAVPKLREGSYFPDWLLTHRRRVEQALVTRCRKPPPDLHKLRWRGSSQEWS